MNWRKVNWKIIAMLLVVMIILTGCTGGGGTTDTPDTVTGDIELQWWGVFWDDAVVSSLIDEYEQANPGVKISYVNKWPGGQRDLAEKLYQDEIDRVLKSNVVPDIPDIFMVNNTWYGNYEKYTSPAPTSLITADTVETAYYPAVSTDFVVKDAVRALPLWMDTLAILYNKDILAQSAVSAPPTNWSQFKTLAETMTTRVAGAMEQAGFAAGTSQNVSFAFELANLLLIQNGVEMTDATGNPIFSTYPEAQTALSFYKSFAGSSGSWATAMENDALEFLKGNVAMIAAPSWRYHDILQYNEQFDLGLNIGVSPMPQLSGQTKAFMNVATYWGNTVALNRPHPEASWKFVNWLSQPEQLKKLRANEKLERDYFAFLYPRADMQQELQNDEYLKVYNAALPNAETWYMVDGLAVKEIILDLIDSSADSNKIAGSENDIQQVITNKGKL